MVNQGCSKSDSPFQRDGNLRVYSRNLPKVHHEKSDGVGWGGAGRVLGFSFELPKLKVHTKYLSSPYSWG